MKAGGKLLLVLALVPLLVLILVLLVLSPSPARAVDSDFDVYRWVIEPEAVGSQAGKVRVTLWIRNTGPSNITWVRVTINTRAGFSESLTLTPSLAPGDTRNWRFEVPIYPADVNDRLVMMVTMNNNASANPDGLKTLPFRVELLDPILIVTQSVSPHRTYYSVGDTVTITRRYTSHVPQQYADPMRWEIVTVQAELSVRNGSAVLLQEAHETVRLEPGETKTTSYEFTLPANSGREVKAAYEANFDFLGKNYSVRDSTSLLVAAPSPDFTAVLTAEPTAITQGEAVTATVNITNTGDYPTDFVIYDSNKVRRGSIEGVAPGASRVFSEQVRPSTSSDISYIVEGSIGEETVNRDTNVVHITVTPAPASSSTTSSEGVTTTSMVDSTTSEPGPTSPADPTGPPATDVSAETAAQEEGGISLTLLIVIIAVAAVAIAAIVTTGVVITRKRTN